MQQETPGFTHPPLRALEPDREVGGYFETGIWRPVRFGDYVRLVEESADGKPPAYIKPVHGFMGFLLLVSINPDFPSLAIPRFCDRACGNDACEGCKASMMTGAV